MRSLKSFIFASMLILGGLSGCGRGNQAGTTSDAQPVTAQNEAPDADAGSVVYAQGCTNCHGTAGQGLIHQGPDLRKNTFIATSSDAVIIDFLYKGRTAKDPANKTGVAMPALGTLKGFGEDKKADDAELADLVAFLRRMQKNAAVREAAATGRQHPSIEPATASAK